MNNEMNFMSCQKAIQSIQSRAGNKLEKIISCFLEKNYIYNKNKEIYTVKKNLSSDNDQFFTQVVSNNKDKTCKIDFLIKNSNMIYLLEMKNGSQFDKDKTNKILENFLVWEKEFEFYSEIKFHIVCFDHKQIKNVRNKLAKYTISGIEFCELFDLNYDIIQTIIQEYKEYKFRQYVNGEKQWETDNDFDHFLSGQAVKVENLKLSKIFYRRSQTLDECMNPS